MELSFYEHGRQHYAEQIPTERPEFMIGDYGEDGGCRGEFKVDLHNFSGVATPRGLVPHAHVFGDGLEQFMVAIANGLGGLLAREDFASPADFARGLLACGFRDRSDTPLA